MDTGAENYRRFLEGDDDGLAGIVREYKDALILFLCTFAPDGTALTFDGTDPSTFFDGLDDPYAWFFDDRAAFIA